MRTISVKFLRCICFFKIHLNFRKKIHLTFWETSDRKIHLKSTDTGLRRRATLLGLRRGVYVGAFLFLSIELVLTLYRIWLFLELYKIPSFSVPSLTSRDINIPKNPRFPHPPWFCGSDSNFFIRPIFWSGFTGTQPDFQKNMLIGLPDRIRLQ